MGLPNVGNMLDLHRTKADAEYRQARRIAAHTEARIDPDEHPEEFRAVLEMLLQPLRMGEDGT